MTGQDLADELNEWVKAVVKRTRWRDTNGWLYPLTLGYNHLIDWRGHEGDA